MEEILDKQIPPNKIYKDRAIWVGSFLGGPLVAGYLIAENFKAFNDSGKAKMTWIYTIIATVTIFSIIFLIPDTVTIPNQFIPIIYTTIAYYLSQHYQGQNITAHINSGGEFFGWWRIIAISIIGLAITTVVILGLVTLTESTKGAEVNTRTYGIMKHEIAFDKYNITENEVDKIAEGFTETTFFDETETKYTYAYKEDDKYEISISVVDEVKNDNQAIKAYTDLKAELQSLFPKNKIVFKLVIGNVDNVIKTIE